MDNTSNLSESSAKLLHSRTKVGAICWILTIEYYIAQLIAQSAWPHYNISQYDVSALGTTACGTFIDPSTQESIYACSPWHAVMNAGFIVLGILIILGTFFLRRVWPKRRLTNVALVLIAVGGVGEILAGYAPGNENVVIHATGEPRQQSLMSSLTNRKPIEITTPFFLRNNSVSPDPSIRKAVAPALRSRFAESLIRL